MDRERFLQAAVGFLGGDVQSSAAGIGTLGEKSLHAVLKRYLEPDETKQEIKIGRYVADISNQHGITEIQTRNFNTLRRKLAFFLPEHPVTVVYPIARIKWLRWLDPQTGELTKRRKSPKMGRPFDIFPELYRIRPLLREPNLTLGIFILEIEEIRLLDGWSGDRKKGSHRRNRIPLDLFDELYIQNPEDYLKLMPGSLPEPFHSRDFAKQSGLSLSAARTALNVLHFVGAVNRCGKKGNTYLYTKTGGFSHA